MRKLNVYIFHIFFNSDCNVLDNGCIYIYIYIYIYLYHKKFEHNARCHWLKAKLKLSRRLPTMSDLFRDLSLAFFVN